MSDERKRDGAMIVLYDGECGFCKVVMAAVLTWDRARRLDAAPIQSARGGKLLSEMPSQARLASWHLVDRAGVIHSGGAAVPAVLVVLPGGRSLAHVTSRFSRTTARAYDWVASHRALLGRLVGLRRRAWAARAIAERERQDVHGGVTTVSLSDLHNMHYRAWDRTGIEPSHLLRLRLKQTWCARRRGPARRSFH